MSRQKLQISVKLVGKIFMPVNNIRQGRLTLIMNLSRIIKMSDYQIKFVGSRAFTLFNYFHNFFEYLLNFT